MLSSIFKTQQEERRILCESSYYIILIEQWCVATVDVTHEYKYGHMRTNMAIELSWNVLQLISLWAAIIHIWQRVKLMTHVLHTISIQEIIIAVTFSFVNDN